MSANRTSDARTADIDAARSLSKLSFNVTGCKQDWEEGLALIKQSISLFELWLGETLSSQEVLELSNYYNQKGLYAGKISDKKSTDCEEKKIVEDEYREEEIDAYLHAVQLLKSIPEVRRDPTFYEYLSNPCLNCIITYRNLKQFSTALELNEAYEKLLEPLKQNDIVLYEMLMKDSIWSRLWTVDSALKDNKFEEAEKGIATVLVLNSQLMVKETRSLVKLAEMLLLLCEKNYSSDRDKRRVFCGLAIEQLSKVNGFTDIIRRLWAKSYFMLFESYPEEDHINRKSALETAANYIESVFQPDIQDKELEAKCQKYLAPYLQADRLDEMESKILEMQQEILDLRRGTKRGAFASNPNVLLPELKHRKQRDEGPDRPTTQSIPSP